MKKSRLLLIGLTLLTAAARGQSQSPGAPGPDQKLLPTFSGSGSLSGIYSPSLFDGSASVSIPIYDFSNEYGSFGISLGYNSQGIKVDDVCGSAGFHWQISGSGAIDRILHDLPDDCNTTTNNGKFVGRLRDYLMAPSQDAHDRRDGENDDYVVSVPGMSFTFKLGRNGFVFTHPQKNAKIELYKNGQVYPHSAYPQYFLDGDYGFRITDEQGNQYIFEASESMKLTLEDGDLNDATAIIIPYISKWDLSKIIFANGQQIVYEYDLSDDPPELILYNIINYRERSDTAGATADETAEIFARDVLRTSSVLKTVYYPNNVTVRFAFDQLIPISGIGPSGRSIKQVTVSSADQCIHYRFNRFYQYADNSFVPAVESPFNDPNYKEDGKRMFLKGIDVLSCDSSIIEPYYSFEYSPVTMPWRNSGTQDLYGYSRGAYAGPTNGVPTHPNIFTGITVPYGQDRSEGTDLAKMTAGYLFKVKNAYGGYLSFQYEKHSGVTNVWPDFLKDGRFLGFNDDDGVRLKSVTEGDRFHANADKITTFTYSGGQRFMPGGLFHYPSEYSSTGAITEYSFGNYFVTPHQFINGANHGYSQVASEVRTTSGQLLSRTVTQFTNLQDGTLLRRLNAGGKQYFQLPFADKQYLRDWEIGLPASVTQYDQNNNIISRTTNTYTSIVDSTHDLGDNIRVSRRPASKNAVQDIFLLPVTASDNYKCYSGKSLLTKSVVEKFISNTVAVPDTMTFDYDNRNNLATTRARNSQGVYTHTRNVYNYMMRPGQGATLDSMTAAGLEKLISTERWTETPNYPLLDHLLDASITGYRYQGGKLWPNRVYSLEVGAPLDYSLYTGITDPLSLQSPYIRAQAAYSSPGQPVPYFKTISEVLQYDSKGNPLEVRLLGQDIYKAMVWDSLTGKKAAEVANARYADIAYTGFEHHNQVLTGIISSGNFRYNASGLNYTGAVTGKACYQLVYQLGGSAGLSTGALTAGKEYVLTYWSKGPAAPVLSGAGLAAASLQPVRTSSGGGWNFYQLRFTAQTTAALSFSTTLAVLVDELRLFPSDCTMESWAYDPLFGPTSVTDGTGRITRFQYDGMGRQAIIRDQEGNIRSKTEYTIGH